MLLLTSTSDIIRVVTGSAVATITVHADWVDNASGTITPGRTNTAITTATTTTVVAAPAASTQRNVKGLSVTNNHASSSNVVTVRQCRCDFPFNKAVMGKLATSKTRPALARQIRWFWAPPIGPQRNSL